MTTAPHALPRPRRSGRRRRAALAVVAALLVAAAVVAFPYRRQIVSYLTHLKGSPTHTEPYVPFPADDPPALRVAVAGDVGDSGRRIDATGRAMAAIEGEHPFDVLLLLGDNVYPSGDPDRLPDTVFQPFAEVLDEGAQLLAIVGNHDRPHADEQMEVLGMPARWWAEELGDVLIVGLDSNHTDDPEQRAWLEATLRDSTARWKIVAVHHPPYSAGYQGSSDEVRERFVPLFERYGVQLVLSGHEHDYQRSVEINGVTYVITGAASGTRRTGEADFTAVSFSWHSYVELGIYPDRLVGRVMNQDNRVADEWTLRPDGG
ncbi:MAG: metallophosphoesterase family protein [Actinomycetota bacterium]